MKHSNYMRVIPRDFFNEAKLLKCMGQLSLKIHDFQLPVGVDISIFESNQPFNIRQLEADGGLFVFNWMVYVNSTEVIMKTAYNSKSNYPLYCELDYEDTLVFDEQGNFTEDFIERFKE